MNDRDIAQDIVKKAVKAGADIADVYISRETSLKIDVLDQKVESSDELNSGGIGLRVIKDKRLGFSFNDNFDQYSFEDLVSSAISNSRNTVRDELLDMPENIQQTRAISLYDTAAEKATYDQKAGIAFQIEKAAYDHSDKIKKTEKITYSETVIDSTIASSKGVNISYKKSIFTGAGEVIAEDAGTMETGHWFSVKTALANIDAKAIGIAAAKKATELLGAKGIKSGVMPVVFIPYTASMLLEALSPAFSADAVLKGLSLFAGKISQRAGSIELSVIDNGLLEAGVGSSPYDDEGTPCGETVLINNGFLSGYLSNTYTGKKLGHRSTGNAVRATYRSLPDVHHTNLYIKNGKDPGIISRIRSGILVETIIGGHTMNPISGDFSIGAAGHLIENGKISSPVRGITIAGNLVDLLHGIEAIGTDLEFFGSTGAPTLLISMFRDGGEA